MVCLLVPQVHLFSEISSCVCQSAFQSSTEVAGAPAACQIVLWQDAEPQIAADTIFLDALMAEH